MIAFDLVCECGYPFEGWFRDYDDFVNQRNAGLISCPRCERTNTVRKVLSPVAVHTKDRSNQFAIEKSQKEIELTQDIESAAKALRMLQDYVEKNFEDVGAEFTEKTLKIHYGVEEPKNIRGIVTVEEEKVLNKEGIRLLKIPLKNEIERN